MYQICCGKQQLQKLISNNIQNDKYIINIIAAYGYRSAIISAKIGNRDNGSSLGW